MANAEMEMNVKITPTIDDEAAKLYLFLVEVYMNAHPELVIEVKREESGNMRYSIEKCFKED